MKLKEVIACTLGACALLLLGGSFRPASAQAAVAAGSSAAVEHWNTANEVSFTGTIHGVTTEHISGTPAGVNLQLDGAQPFQYANLGSQVNSSLKSQLAAGQPVTLKGILRSFNGQKILMVREITINQQTMQVRSTRGIVSPLVDAAAAQGNRPRGKNAIAGGAQ